MVSLVRGGLSLVNLSTYGVIVFFFNLKVKKKKEKAVNHKIDNNNFQSCKINLKTDNFCIKVEVEIIDHGVKKTVLKEVENTECIDFNVTFIGKT